MITAPIESSSSVPNRSEDANRNFDGLRSLKWRINLGILPSSSVDDLRRVTADSRRRYAGLRRRLLIDPQALKEGTRSADVVIDNPLSLNPDSTWGRFFRSAELEKMVDQDLSRLYPEHGSYFQTQTCQSMLRRILLLWCLRHSEFGYRQGMHELLAPLLYVLHVDVERLVQVRKQFEDHFMDKFDGSFNDDDLTYDFDFRKSSEYLEEDKVGSTEISSKERSLNELDSEIQTIILLTDAYGAEGELGIVISDKFLEHDAYCMFDALMSGAKGSVAMAEFFSPSPAIESQSGLSPVIEASAAVYHLLSLVDSSLHTHLVELGVEPQYFALRWLRVLFGREFSLGDLLVIWDEIFASENGKLDRTGNSPRGALISAMAVSMLLYLRSSLLATEHATSCLQRLLNFPEKVDLKKLLEKAKCLQTFALETDISYNATHHQLQHQNHRSKSMVSQRKSESFDTALPVSPLHQGSVSYWEEKWRVHHREEELRQDGPKQQRKKGWTEKVKLSLTRTESEPLPRKLSNGRKIPKSSVRRRLLEDLSRELGLDGDIGSVGENEVLDDKEEASEEEEDEESNEDITCSAEDRSLSGNHGSEEGNSSSIFSEPTSPRSVTNDNENESEKSSVASNLSLDNDSTSTLPISCSPIEEETQSHTSERKDDSAPAAGEEAKEKKPLSGKFQWLWKFGRNNVAATTEGTSEKPSDPIEASKPESDPKPTSVSTADKSDDSTEVCDNNGDGGVADQNVMVTIKNLGHSMLDHIQVIESVFQQERVENFSKNNLVGKGQVTAMVALKELRKISNLLSEM